jgi:hypothetical protein
MPTAEAFWRGLRRYRLEGLIKEEVLEWSAKGERQGYVSE